MPSSPPRGLPCGPLLAATLMALIACDDASHLTSTATRVTLRGDQATTTMSASAARATGGHGDGSSSPRSGLDLRGGPWPGELIELVETSPGVYRAEVPAAPKQIRYALEGHAFVHDLPPHFTAEATLLIASPPAARVSWDPPLVLPSGVEHVEVRVLRPSGEPPPFGCATSSGMRATAAGQLDLPDCSFDGPGSYTITVHRILGGVGDEENGDFLYAWATREVMRELTLTVP